MTRPEQAPAEPLTAAAAFERAVSLAREGRTVEAEELYRTVLAHDPEHAGALQELAALRLQALDFAEAASLLARCIERDPGSSAAHNNRDQRRDQPCSARQPVRT